MKCRLIYCLGLCLLATLSTGIGGCSKDVVIVCPTTISFAQDIQPILTRNCTESGCHGQGSHSGSLNLDTPNTYSHLARYGTGYILAGDPANSILYERMTTAADAMPKVRLGHESTDKIYCWIKQGALNN